ncbi:MAG: alanine-zipper protein [Oscillospiraceae bacterium]|nr:alanine-zipper protein [Oscillospiraceae bacterium]
MPMSTNWVNSRPAYNGSAKPPIVLRSEAEELIAQNCHNLVWRRHQKEYNELMATIQAGGDNVHEVLKDLDVRDTEVNNRWRDMHRDARAEIAQLIKDEIADYRNAVTANPLQMRIEELEAQIRQLKSSIDEVYVMAEEAMSMAEEAQSAAEEAMEACGEGDEE